MKGLFYFLLLCLVPFALSGQLVEDVVQSVTSDMTEAITGIGEVSLLDAGKGSFDVDTESWTAYASNTIAQVTEDGYTSLKVTYVDNTRGAYMFLRETADINTDLTIGVEYTFKVRAKINVGTVYIDFYDGSGYTPFADLTTVFAWYEFVFTANSTTGCLVRGKGMGGSEIFYIDEWDLVE